MPVGEREDQPERADHLGGADRLDPRRRVVVGPGHAGRGEGGLGPCELHRAGGEEGEREERVEDPEGDDHEVSSGDRGVCCPRCEPSSCGIPRLRKVQVAEPVEAPRTSAAQTGSSPRAVVGSEHNEGVDVATLRRERLRSHRLSAPAPTIADGRRAHARHAGAGVLGRPAGRSPRARGAPRPCATSMRPSTAARSCGRGRCAARSTSSPRATSPGCCRSPASGSSRKAARGAPRARAIDADELAGPSAPSARCGGGNGSPRKELFAVLEAGGVSTAGQRGYHLLYALSLRGVVCQGPVVPRAGGPTREQYFVLHRRVDHGCRVPGRSARRVLRPLHRLARPGRRARLRVVVGAAARGRRARRRKRHPIASQSSPTTPSRMYVAAGPAPRRSATAPEVWPCRPFEEYYLSYVDRTVPCAPEFLARDRAGHERHRAADPRRARRGRRRLDALGRGGPARRRPDPRAVPPGCRDGCRDRRRPRPLPRLHHG